MPFMGHRSIQVPQPPIKFPIGISFNLLASKTLCQRVPRSIPDAPNISHLVTTMLPRHAVGLTSFRMLAGLAMDHPVHRG